MIENGCGALAGVRVSVWAAQNNQGWIDTLGELAERTGHRGCAERFEAGKRMLAEERELERLRREAEPDDEDIPGPYR